MEDIQFEPEKKIAEVYSKTCPHCNKVITAMTRKQLEWNFRIHHYSHKKTKKEEKQEDVIGQ